MDITNYSITGGVSYFAEHFGHHKFNTILRMPSVLLSESLAVELEGRDQWPQDAKLYQPLQVEQILLPDTASCFAVQAYLKMNRLPFTIIEKHNAEYMSPSGKVPFIKCGAFVVSEMDAIVAFVNNKGITLTDTLDPTQKADMRAFMSLVYNILTNAELYLCWLDNETYDMVTKPRYGSVLPWPLNHIVTASKRRAVWKKLEVLQWHKKTVEEVVQDVEYCCKLLSDRLEDGPYFFGKKPTELDALVFGHLFAILTTQLPGNKISSVIKNYPKLITLCHRIEKDYFEKHE